MPPGPLLINEFVFNHTGSDSDAFIELFGDPNTDYSTLTLLEIEGDAGSPTGTIDYAGPVGLTDANGYWLSGEDVENGTVTLLLVEGFSGSAGDDLDTNDDGVLDNTPWTSLVDAVAVTDGGSGDLTYAGTAVLMPGFDGGSLTVGGASRIPNGTDTDQPSDWVRNSFAGAGLASFPDAMADPGEAINTPGAENEVVPPAGAMVINEFVFNHTGSDSDAFIELFGDANTDYSSLTLLEIEGDAGSPTGTIDYAGLVGLTDANGYWLSGEDVENGTVSLLLVEGFSGSAGDDLDTNDDGVLDNTPWTSIVDAVAVTDGGSGDLTYAGTAVLMPGFDGGSLSVGGASRIPNGTDTDQPSDWVRNSFAGAGLASFPDAMADPGEAINTPGAENEVFTVPIMLVISEIMYNTNSAEPDWEWVELYNKGTTPIDLAGFVLDDNNTLNHTSANISTGMIEPGQTAVLYNGDALTTTEFEAAWGRRINLVPVANWGVLNLGNSGDQIGLWSSFTDYSGDHQTQSNALISIAFDDSTPWPADNNSASIYLTDLSADPTDGANWALSMDDINTPAGGAAYTARDEGGNSGNDVGSPGGEFVFPGELLLTEVKVSPTSGEFIEIYNPNDFAVELDDVYLTDATSPGSGNYYYNIVTGANAGGSGSSDFLARFPEGARIEPDEYQTIALPGSDDFFTEYGQDPTYELIEDGGSPDAIPDMREGLPGTIDGGGGLTNTGEVVILFYWDGTSDLVQDLDYLVWGDQEEAVDKTGIAVDGPDADSAPSAYQDETDIADQTRIAAGAHSDNLSWQRARLDEILEVQFGGNGFDGDDETSEDMATNWCSGVPTPNAAGICDEVVVECPMPTHLIHEIQGSGTVSPLVNDLVRIQGVVVGDFQGSDALGGFFVQEEDTDIDADPNTSEGVFVFDADVVSPLDVALGDQVFVLGQVAEVDGETQIRNVSGVLLCMEGEVGDMPTPTAVSLPYTSATEAERFEGMHVQFENELTVISLRDLDRFGEVLLSGNDLQEQFTENNDPDVANNMAYLESQERFRVLLDDQQNGANNYPVFHQPVGAVLRGGYTIPQLTGIMSEAFGSYRIRPNVRPGFAASNPRPVEAPPRTGALKVASFNLENYFTTFGSRGAADAAAFAQQTKKLVAAIAKMDAHLLGLVELENNYTAGSGSAIATLVAALNAELGPGTYDYIDPGVNVGNDEIAVGVIYQPATLTPVGNPAILDMPMAVFQENRAVLAQTFIESLTGEQLTIAVNHFKSKGGATSPGTGNADVDDGQGKNNAVRTEAATAVIDWLNTDPTSSGNADFLVVGDLNAYMHEDPLRIFEDAGYVNLVPQGHSFEFDGYRGDLDYILASASLAEKFVSGEKWAINADESDLFAYAADESLAEFDNFYQPNEFRSSDHDPVVASFYEISDMCSCQDMVHVSLDDDCSYSLSLEQLGQGVCFGYEIVVNDANPGNGNIIDCPGRYTYGLFDVRGEIVCWGEVLAEDKSGPAFTYASAKTPTSINGEPQTNPDKLECFYLDFLVNNRSTWEDPDFPYFLGAPTFSDNCDNANCTCAVTVGVSDRVEYFDCEGQVAFGEAYDYANLIRTFTGSDCEGNQTAAKVTYTFFRPALSSLRYVGDLSNTDINACNLELENIDAEIYCNLPFWYGAFNADGRGAPDLIFLNQLECNYSFSVETTTFPICNGQGFKVSCAITVFDWCAGESQKLPRESVVKVGDFAAPEFDGNAIGLDETGTDSDLVEGAFIIDEIEQPASIGPDIEEVGTLADLLELDSLGMIPVISTGPVDCTGPLSLELDALQRALDIEIEDNCAEELNYTVSTYTFGPELRYGIPFGPDIWRPVDYAQVNNHLVGLPVGIYALVIEVFDGCYNAAKAVVFFQVEDLVSPVMKCDDDLQVSLSTTGYAKVYAADVDEGSWDNCELDKVEVRRIVPEDCLPAFEEAGYDIVPFNLYDGFDIFGTGLAWAEVDDVVVIGADGVARTGWNDYTEFFCCDLAAAVTIELRGMDKAKDPLSGMKMPNSNICWLDITLEDKFDPICVAPAPIKLMCDDADVAAILAGDLSVLDELPTTQFGAVCGATDVSYTVENDLDQCGIGELTLSWTVTTGTSSSTNECEQRVVVAGHHDYWVKFPADASGDCDELFDADGVAGVEYSENACDLLAVSHEDETFFATQDPNACYKIFRTYKVINWCEYDGESLPTVVSRDWDAHNGVDDGTDFQEYNLNPEELDGDNAPGDEDIYVIVDVDFLADAGIVYYDNTSDPDDESTAGLAGDNNTTVAEGYWWAVTAGTGFDDRTFNNYGWFDFEPFSPDGNAPRGFTLSDLYDIDGNDFQDDNDDRYGSFGYWQYTQHIVVYDDVDPELTGLTANNMPMESDTLVFAGGIPGTTSDFACGGDVYLELTASDNCAEEVKITVDIDAFNTGTIDFADFGAALADTVRLPDGEHRAVITLDDGCGNRAVQEVIVVVADKKAPTPVVIDAISVELMPDGAGGGMMTVWATDFLADSQGDDCSGPVTYSVNREGETPDQSQIEITVTCADAVQTLPVEIHAWDAAGNHDFVRTFLLVQDNMGVCDQEAGAGTIAGSIITEQEQTVREVDVQLSGGQMMQYMTNATGTYAFNGLPEGFDFTVIPLKDDDHQNGVSTFDLVQMQRHILGMQQLASPYQWIAADINKSGTVTTLDLIQLRKLILNIDTEFSSNTSWRFVDADYTFSNPDNPLAEAFPEVKNLNNLAGEELADFMAIKIGDVNGSALSDVQPRSGKQFTIDVDAPQQLQAGETYEVTFTTEDLSRISGYQFTLQVEGAEILDMQGGIAQAEHFGVFREEGVLTVSWNSEFGVRNAEVGNRALFKITVRAKADLPIEQVLQLSSRYTVAEAYDAANHEVMGVALQFGDAAQEGANELYQNIPNPFLGETVISFNLMEATEGTLIVQDVTGRILNVVEGDFAKGYNQVRLTASDLPTTGVFYYTLQAGAFTATRKMILIE